MLPLLISAMDPKLDEPPPNLRELKKKRANRKGNVTKSVNSLNRSQSKPLKNITADVITCLRMAATDAVSAYE